MMHNAALLHHAVRDVADAVFFFGVITGLVVYGILHFIVHIARKPFKNRESA